MRRIERPPTIAPDITYDEMLIKTKEVMRREISHLLMESAKGKLSPASGRDLTAYIKALQDLADREEGLLGNMTEEQLRAIIKDTNEKPIDKPESRRVGLAEKASNEDKHE